MTSLCAEAGQGAAPGALTAMSRLRDVPGGGVLPRRFLLVREHAVAGVSGAGVVAFGVCWPDGAAALRWRPGRRPAGEADKAVYDHVSDVETAHGHGGTTVVEWVD